MSETDPTIPAASGPATSGKSGSNVISLPAAATAERPSDKVIAFAKNHPVLIVTGALAAGVLVSALLPRKSGRRLAGKAVDIAKATGAASLLFGRKVDSKANALSDGVRKQATLFAGKAETTGETVVHHAEKYGLAAIAAAAALGRATAKRAGHLGGHLGDIAADKAGKLGDIATQKSAKVTGLASELKHRIGR